MIFTTFITFSKGFQIYETGIDLNFTETDALQASYNIARNLGYMASKDIFNTQCKEQYNKDIITIERRKIENQDKSDEDILQSMKNTKKYTSY